MKKQKAMVTDEQTADLLDRLATASDDPEEVARVARIERENFRQFMREAGLEQDAVATALLNAAATIQVAGPVPGAPQVARRGCVTDEVQVQGPTLALAPTPSVEAEGRFAENPGTPVDFPRVLWVGAGNFFERVSRAQTFEDLLRKQNALITVVDVHPIEKVKGLPKHDNVKYFDVSNREQRRNLLYNRTKDENRLFTHCYIANWPQAHLLSAVKYSSLCAGGDVIITKPLDLNIPLVETVASGVFPDIQKKIVVDDHYRNKGCVRELHRILPQIQRRHGKLCGFRMWLVEDKTIEEENRLQALECGVIWDLASHLFSLLQLFFLDYPHQGLKAYCKDENPNDLRNVKVVIDKVFGKRYIGCQLKNASETFAAIELKITFDYRTYLNTWQEQDIWGLFIVAKAASHASGVGSPVKQIDLCFQGETINLNLGTERLKPPLNIYLPRQETGFHRSVVELLKHSYRQAKQANAKFDREENQSPGRYHCGMSFADSCFNVRLIQKALEHPTRRDFQRGYEIGRPVLDIVGELIARDYLSRDWLDEKRYGTFIR